MGRFQICFRRDEPFGKLIRAALGMAENAAGVVGVALSVAGRRQRVGSAGGKRRRLGRGGGRVIGMERMVGGRRIGGRCEQNPFSAPISKLRESRDEIVSS